MTLSFLQHAISPRMRNNRRKVEPTRITWETLPEYFSNQIKKTNKRLLRQTVSSKLNKAYPYEMSLKFGNANVPFGYDPMDADERLTSIPCKDWEQGKKQIEEYIDAIESDKEVRKLLVEFLTGKQMFDSSTLPSDLLGGV